MVSKLTCVSEIAAILYLFGYMFQAPIVEQYVYTRYSHELGFNYSSSGDHAADSCRNITENSTSYQIEKKVGLMYFLLYHYSTVESLISDYLKIIFFIELLSSCNFQCELTRLHNV